jgi:hypothetical protein
MTRQEALDHLAALPDPRAGFERRAELMRAAFYAGARVTEIANAARCDRKDVYRAIRKETAS